MWIIFSREVGKDKSLLRLDVVDRSNSRFSCIEFDLGQLLSELKLQNHFSVPRALEENEFNGVTNLQLRTKDLKFEVQKNPHQR